MVFHKIKIYNRLSGFRDLLLVFIWREFSIRYRQSVIGVVWAILQPLSMMFLFTFIFTYVMPSKITHHPYVIFFYAGLLPWSFFSSSLNYSIPSLTNHYDLITKIYFPREILPISGIAVAFADFVFASSVYWLLLLFFRVVPDWHVLWFIPLLLLLIVYTVSLSLILSALNVYYRDVRLASTFLIQLFFFSSPVFYSIDRLSLKLKIILFLNPLTFIIENMRRCVLEGRGVALWQFIIVGTIIWIFFEFSYRFFLKTEKRFADVI